MQIDYGKAGVLGAWVLLMGGLAFSFDVTSMSGWTALVALGFLPLVLTTRMWNPRVQPAAERVSKVLR